MSGDASRERPTLAAELKALLQLALPLMLTNLGIALMPVVDTAVVGRAGAQALAGIALANLLYFAIAVLGHGVMMGLDPLIAQAVGARDAAKARMLAWQAGYLALLTSAVLAVPMLLVPLVLPLFGIPEEVRKIATSCLYIRALAMPAHLAFIGARAYLQGIGRPKALLVAILLANIFNLGSDILLVFGGAGLPGFLSVLHDVPAFGAPGAAWATNVALIIELLVAMLAISRIRPPEVQRAPRGPDARSMLQAARVGLPIGLHLAAEVGIFSLAGLLAGKLGEVELAAHQIALSVASVSFQMALGISSASAVRMGWAIGSHQSERARSVGIAAFLGGGALMGVCALVFSLFPESLARSMTTAPEVIRVAGPLLVVAAFFQLSDGAQAVGAGVLRGAADTRFTFVANLVGHYAIGLPVAVLLGLGLEMGIVGVWWGLCAGLSAVAVALFVRFWRLTDHPIAAIAQS